MSGWIFSLQLYCTVAVLCFSLEGQVKEVMHRAFWDSLAESLRADPPDYTHALVLLKEIKEVIIIIVAQTLALSVYNNRIVNLSCAWLTWTDGRQAASADRLRAGIEGLGVGGQAKIAMSRADRRAGGTSYPAADGL